MQMKVNKIILKLKKKIKLDSMKIGVAKITPVGTINIDENGTYDVTNYNEAIVEIPMPSGEIEINSNGLYDVTNFASAEVNCPTDLDWSAIGYNERPKFIDDGYNYAKAIKNNWDASVTNLNYKYSSDFNLKFMPVVDFSNVTYASNCFQYSNISGDFIQNDCSSLIDIRSMFYRCNSINKIKMYKLNSLEGYCNDAFRECSILEEVYLDAPESNLNSIASMFRDCINLKTINVFNTSKIHTFNSAFSGCNSLTNDSLNNIMQMCINATSFAGTKTLQHLGLSSTQATTCQGLSNYQAFLNAGWTTGY